MRKKSNCWQDDVCVEHIDGNQKNWDAENIMFVHGATGVPLTSPELSAFGNYILLKTLIRPDHVPDKARVLS